MKKIVLLLFIFLLVVGNMNAQKSVTIEIEKLKRPGKLLKTVPPTELFSRYETNLLRLSITDNLVDKGTHPVLSGFLQAYQEHRPVTISPDVIWLLICQGFAQHVNNNAEELREKIVGFEGQKELTVTRIVPDGDILKFPWESIFPEFVERINESVGKDLVKILKADFTTTTPASEIASQITIMETMKQYFKYKVVMMGCGIPAVTIEGSLKDWEKILQRLDVLAQYDLNWWTDELRPVIQQIIAAIKGQVDKEFWMSMVRYHQKGFYGSLVDIDGWLVKFFPYRSSKKRADLKKIEDIEDVPDEIVRVPFEFWDEVRGESFKMEFWAGFMGLHQDKQTKSLKPAIGWAINRL